MALGGSESLEEWKSVDQLLSDLFQDPGVSSLINGTTDSSTNWRPWSSPDMPQTSACSTSCVLTQQDSGNADWPPSFSPLSETRPVEPLRPQLPPDLPLPPLTRLPSRVLDSPTTPPKYHWHVYNAPSKPANHALPTPPTTPVSQPATPRVLNSPMSPQPQSLYASYPNPPHAQQVMQLDYNYLTDVEVSLRTNLNDFWYGKRGAVRSISANYTATVYVYDSFREIQIPCNYLKLVTPSSFDHVKVLAGRLKGTVGVLISSTGENGILQCQDSARQLCQVSIQHVGRYVPPNPRTLSPQQRPPCPASSRPPLYEQAIQHMHHPAPVTATNAVGGDCYGHSKHHHSDFRLLSPARTVYSRKPPAASCNPVRGRITNPVLAAAAAAKTALYKEQYKQLFKSIQGQSGTETSAAPGQKSTWELLEEVMKRPSPVFNINSLDEASDVKTSSVRVSLVCPLSQSRMTYPCRGIHCGHLQCFDAEAYIEFNHNQKMKTKVKKPGGRVQHVGDKRWICPVCHKLAPSNHLYIDRTVLKIARETSALEVEFDRSGSWKLMDDKPSGKEVIDLTLDDGDDDR